MNLRAVYEEVERILPKDRHFCIQLEVVRYSIGDDDPTIKINIYEKGQEWITAPTPEAALVLFHANHPAKSAGNLETVADVQVPEAVIAAL